MIQFKEIIFILREWQRESLSEHNDLMTCVREVTSAKCVFA